MSGLKGQHQIGRIEVSVVIPIAVGKTGVVGDAILKFSDLEDMEKVVRIEQTICVGVSHDRPDRMLVVSYGGRVEKNSITTERNPLDRGGSNLDHGAPIPVVKCACSHRYPAIDVNCAVILIGVGRQVGTGDKSGTPLRQHNEFLTSSGP